MHGFWNFQPNAAPTCPPPKKKSWAPTRRPMPRPPPRPPAPFPVALGQVDVADEFGATPLLCAARRGATISSLYLSKRGACLKARDQAGLRA